MSLTTIVAKAFLARQKSLEHHAHHAEALQERVLKYLIGRENEMLVFSLKY